MKNSQRRNPKSGNHAVVKRMVRDMIQAQVERKRIVQVSNGTMSTSGAIIYYSSIAQGDTLNNRTGDKILVKELHWTFGYSDSVTGIGRIMVVQDALNTGTSPAVTDILSGANPQSHLNPVTHLQNRFKVLVDRTFTTSVAGRQYINASGSVKVKQPTFFNGTGSTSADAGRGAIFVLVIGGQATGGYAINIDMAFTDA